jgi:hypothetical protein
MDKTENYYCPAKDITRHVEIWLKSAKRNYIRKLIEKTFTLDKRRENTCIFYDLKYHFRYWSLLALNSFDL